MHPLPHDPHRHLPVVARRPHPGQRHQEAPRERGSRCSIGPHRDGFRLPAKHERDATFGVELDHLARRLVDRPDVVLRIDAQTNRGIETVHVLTELTYELAALFEFEQSRPAV